MSKILVADPKTRLNCENMMKHPWMTKELDSDAKLSTAKAKLSKYVSVRREKSHKQKKNDSDDEFGKD